MLEGTERAGPGSGRRRGRFARLGKASEPGPYERCTRARPRAGAPRGTACRAHGSGGRIPLLRDLCDPSTRAHTRCYVAPKITLRVRFNVCGEDVTRNVSLARRITSSALLGLPNISDRILRARSPFELYLFVGASKQLRSETQTGVKGLYP